MRNKIMDHSKSKKPIYIFTDRLPSDKLKQPIRVELQKKSINPELTRASQQQEKSYNSHATDFIKSPLQKDHFMFKSQINRTDPAISISNSQKLSSTGDPDAYISRSFKSLQLKQTFNYLQQVISDLSERKQFSSTRKYVRLLQGKLGQCCQRIIMRIEKGEQQFKKVSENYFQAIKRMLGYYFRVDVNKGMSQQKVMNQLQRVIKGLIDASQSRRMSSKQKIKENKLLNSKLQKESQQLQRFYENQKAKLKQSYEQIYRKIYQQKSKYKKQLQKSNKMVEEEQRQQQILKEKCEKIFKDISEELTQLKHQYNQIKQQSTKDKNKIAILKGLLFSKEEELCKLNERNQELTKQVKYYDFQILNYKAAAKIFEVKVINFQQQISQLKLTIAEAEQAKQAFLQAKQNEKIQDQDWRQKMKLREEKQLFQTSNKQLFSKMQQIQIRIRREVQKRQQKQQQQKQFSNDFTWKQQKQAMNTINEAIKQQESSQISLYQDFNQATHNELLNKVKQKQEQLQQLNIQYAQICQLITQKKCELDYKMQQLAYFDSLLVDKKSNIQFLNVQLAKIQITFKQKHNILRDLDAKCLNLNQEYLDKQIQLQRFQQELTAKISQSNKLSIHIKELENQLEVKEKLSESLRETEASFKQTSKELIKIESTKKQLQNEIVGLMEVLVRLQSDKMIKVQMCQENQIIWVQKFWKWMKDVNGLSQFL